MADEIQCVSCGLRFPPQNDHQGKMVLCPHCRRPTRNEPAAPSPAAANPYASPQAPTPPLVAEPHQGSPVESPEIYRALAGTRPWAFFLGILGFIVSGIGAFVAIVRAAFWSSSWESKAGFVANEMVILVAVVLVALASWFLFQYGRRIGIFLRTQDTRDLERALSSQRSFWRIAGIMLLAAIPILLVLALLVG
jgi:hypothetical protein